MFRGVSFNWNSLYIVLDIERSGHRVVRLRCLPLDPGVVGAIPSQGHDHDCRYDTSNGWFQEADSKVIYLSLK